MFDSIAMKLHTAFNFIQEISVKRTLSLSLCLSFAALSLRRGCSLFEFSFWTDFNVILVVVLAYHGISCMCVSVFLFVCSNKTKWWWMVYKKQQPAAITTLLPLFFFHHMLSFCNFNLFFSRAFTFFFSPRTLWKVLVSVLSSSISSIGWILVLLVLQFTE